MPDPAATIVITTKDRRDELRQALRSAATQTGCEIDVLVIDDGSTDGTSEMVAAEFPGVRVARFERSGGLIGRRNDAADLVAAPILVSIDDDAVFTADDTVARTVAEFDDPRVGVVAIPYVDTGRGETQVRQRAPDASRLWLVEPYRGTAHAIRLDVFRGLGGYRRELVRQGEEADYCLRMLAAGYVTRLGSAAPIHHHESPRRVMGQVIWHMARNDLLHLWHNVPMPYLVGRAAKVVIWMLGPMTARHREPLAALRGLAAGFACALRGRADRRPVPRAVYRLSDEIRRRSPVALDAVADRLPPRRTF